MAEGLESTKQKGACSSFREREGEMVEGLESTEQKGGMFQFP